MDQRAVGPVYGRGSGRADGNGAGGGKGNGAGGQPVLPHDAAERPADADCDRPQPGNAKCAEGIGTDGAGGGDRGRAAEPGRGLADSPDGKAGGRSHGKAEAVHY